MGMKYTETAEKSAFRLLWKHLSSRTRRPFSVSPTVPGFKSHTAAQKGPREGVNARRCRHCQLGRAGQRRKVKRWGSAGRGGAAAAAARVPAGGHLCPGQPGRESESPSWCPGRGWETWASCASPEDCRAGSTPPTRRRQPRKGRRWPGAAGNRGACAHTCASCRCPGAARARWCARACARVYTRTREGGGTGRAGARRELGRRAPRHTQPWPPPPPDPHPPHPQDSTGQLPFSSLHTFFFLLLGYMLPWGWLALSCKFPRLTGKQGVCGVGGVGGGTREEKKCKRLRVPRHSPIAALFPQPALGFGSHPPQPRGRRHSSTSEPVN